MEKNDFLNEDGTVSLKYTNQPNTPHESRRYVGDLKVGDPVEYFPENESIVIDCNITKVYRKCGLFGKIKITAYDIENKDENIRLMNAMPHNTDYEKEMLFKAWEKNIYRKVSVKRIKSCALVFSMCEVYNGLGVPCEQ